MGLKCAIGKESVQGKGSSLDHDLIENNRLWYWIWYASWFNGWVKRLIVINKYNNYCCSVNFAIVFEEYVKFGNYIYNWWFVDLYIWLLVCEIEMWLAVILSLEVLKYFINFEVWWFWGIDKLCGLRI